MRSWLLIIPLLISCARTELPDGFVYLDKVDITIQVDLRYAGYDNFVGVPVNGYSGDRVIMTRPTAEALSRVQERIGPQGLGLKVFDAYRPQRAVDHFMRWTKVAGDTLTKSKYYPNLQKDSLVPQGYIWKKSGHSRGSTVDLTLIYTSGAKKGEEVNMGTGWDYFGPESWPSYEGVESEAYAMRQLLRQVMMAEGFSPLREEWWHFTLRDEPFPDTYFDFSIE